jgi:hypothetical protein
MTVQQVCKCMSHCILPAKWLNNFWTKYHNHWLNLYVHNHMEVYEYLQVKPEKAWFLGYLKVLFSGAMSIQH